MRHTRYGWLPKRTTLVGESFTVIVIVAFMGLVSHTLTPTSSNTSSILLEVPPEATEWRIKPDCSENDIQCLIHKYSNKYGVNTDTALRIADCESSMGKNLHNPNSTAKGVYQWVDSTWEYTGGGNVLDPKQNIERFMQFYNDNRHWWVCK